MGTIWVHQVLNHINKKRKRIKMIRLQNKNTYKICFVDN